MNSEDISQNTNNEDEINLLEYLYVLVKHKWIIIAMALLGFLGGYSIALYIGPVYIADAIIASKEVETQQTPNLSGMGFLGAMAAAQLNVGGNASLEKITFLTENRTFNAAFAAKYNIASFLFPEFWDSTRKTWRDTVDGSPFDSSSWPKPLGTGGYFVSKFLQKEMLKNGTMSIRVAHKDSLTAYTLLSYYITFLDDHIRETAQLSARENRDYLDTQLLNIADPLVRTKLQELIAKEVEKMMVVSKPAFRVVDDVLVGMNFKEKKIFPLLGFVGMLFLTISLVILSHAVGKLGKTEEDFKYVDGIKRQIFKLPFFR